jgi:type II restriction enzyme
MFLKCDVSAAAGYTSSSQIARVLSESWFESNVYCLACHSDKLNSTSANTQATDFVCPDCKQNYELKTFLKKPARSLVDGAYGAMMKRIRSGSAPTLMMLERTEQWNITGLTAVHHLFLTPNIIEQRKPLSSTARRAGWIGCNIRLDQLAPDAKISVIEKGIENNQKLVRTAFQRFEQLKEIKPAARGWTTLTLQVVRSLGKDEFTLKQIYAKEDHFAVVYPDNHHVRDKIRQQLQILRDLGYVEFLGDASYRIVL